MAEREAPSTEEIRQQVVALAEARGESVQQTAMNILVGAVVVGAAQAILDSVPGATPPVETPGE